MDEATFVQARKRFLTQKALSSGWYVDAAKDRGLSVEEYIRDEDVQDELAEDLWYESGGVELILEDGSVKTAKVVETTGGMDEGSGASITFEIDGKFYTKTGYYASHYGYDWDGEWYESEVVMVPSYQKKKA